MRKSMLYICALAAAVILAPAALRAQDITYTFNEAVGPGSVSGTLTTDGTIGTLTQANILDWNLNINDGTDGTFDLLGPLSGNNSEALLTGTDLTSTSTQLLFNFDGTDSGFFAIENPGIALDGPFIGYNSLYAYFDSPQSINISSDNGETTVIQPTFTGDQVIATAAVAATPEPSSLLLLGSGLVGLWGTARRKLSR